MSDSQLALQAHIPHPLEEQLLDFVTWLFDTATEDGASTVEDHKNLIANYVKERNL